MSSALLSPMNGEEPDFIAAIVKAAIGESKLYVTKVNCPAMTGGELGRTVTLTVQGDVNGTLTLDGKLASKVIDIARSSALLKQKDEELEKARTRVRQLEGRLEAMHKLSDPKAGVSWVEVTEEPVKGGGS